jgi:hypothetical protein
MYIGNRQSLYYRAGLIADNINTLTSCGYRKLFPSRQATSSLDIIKRYAGSVTFLA